MSTEVTGLPGSRRAPLTQKAVRVRVTAADLTAAATSQNINATATIPAGAIVRHAYVKLIEPFADAPITAQTITASIGSGASNVFFLEGVEVGASAGTTPGTYASDPADPSGATAHAYPLPLAAVRALHARIANQTTNVVTLVAGEAEFVVVYDMVEDP